MFVLRCCCFYSPQRQNTRIRIRIRIRIYLLASRILLWDILRLPSSRRAALGLYVILTLWRGRGANQPPYALLHRSSPCYALRHERHQGYSRLSYMNTFIPQLPSFVTLDNGWWHTAKGFFLPTRNIGGKCGELLRSPKTSPECGFVALRLVWFFLTL